jgi:hypothetical protein
MSNPQNSKCPICGTDAYQGPDWAVPDFECIRCGQFKVSDIPQGWLQVKSPDHMVRLSGWVREQNASGNVPTITPDVSKRISTMSLPRYLDRALKVLKIIAVKYPGLERWSAAREVSEDLDIIAASYSQDATDAYELIQILRDEGFLTYDGGVFHVSVPGLLKIEAMSGSGTASGQGFVAMDFAESMRDAWTNGFDPGIRAAGFRPMRIDSKDYVGGITDEIMSEIRQSRFVVADYTGQKSGVYFEAGFALGLGLTVIPTCRADEIKNLHFDIRHLNTLPWNTPSHLADGLTKRIRGVVGTGPNI